jgi:hypothetical protein
LQYCQKTILDTIESFPDEPHDALLKAETTATLEKVTHEQTIKDAKRIEANSETAECIVEKLGDKTNVDKEDLAKIPLPQLRKELVNMSIECKIVEKGHTNDLKREHNTECFDGYDHLMDAYIPTMGMGEQWQGLCCQIVHKQKP